MAIGSSKQSLSDKKTCQQLAADLNTKIPAAVYGMAKASVDIPPGYHITMAKVTKLTANECDLNVAMCKGDLCQMARGQYQFQPPIHSVESFPKQIRAIYNTVCAPKLYWMVTKPLALLIIIILSLIGYGTNILGVVGMVDYWEDNMPQWTPGIAFVFGSVDAFCRYAVQGAWYFSLVAHGYEAFYTAQECHSELRLNLSTTMMWTLLVFMCGYPIFVGEFFEMVQFSKRSKKQT